jgi:hypothetical protein
MAGFARREQITVQFSCSFACMYLLAGTGYRELQLSFCMSGFSSKDLATLQCNYLFACPVLACRVWATHAVQLFFFQVRFFFPGPCNISMEVFFYISGFACRDWATV